MKLFEEGIVETTFEANDSVFVIDEGYLLHSVVWRKNRTFKSIIDSYFSYIIRKYGKKATVVFDGYPHFPTTKLQEQERRATKKSSHTILFNENTVCITQQSEFLANPQNKKRLIEAVKQRQLKKIWTLSPRRKTLTLSLLTKQGGMCFTITPLL